MALVAKVTFRLVASRFVIFSKNVGVDAEWTKKFYWGHRSHLHGHIGVKDKYKYFLLEVLGMPFIAKVKQIQNAYFIACRKWKPNGM